MSDGLTVSVDDPLADDVRSLLEHHLRFTHEVTPAGHVHALDIEALLRPEMTLFSARRNGELLGVGCLQELAPTHGELKSMHTRTEARGQGVGRALVEHLLRVARQRGYLRVSLETGTYEAFGPARALYSSLGFEVSAPFADYTANPHSVCMTIALGSE